MNARDYFALNATPTRDQDGDIPLAHAKLVMDTEPPIWGSDRDSNRKAFLWWIEAEARIRYMHADAMLAVRAIGSEIAAAPDLLDIVVRLESFLTRQGWRPDFHSPESDMLRDCRAAMAKVQGDGP